MSKKGNRTAANYNRPSGGYQKNLYRQKMNQEGIKAPKTPDAKKLRIIGIALIVVWVIIAILLVIYLKWKGLLIGVVLGALLAGGMYLYLQNKQTEMIRYYKKIGLTEEMYITELKRRNVPPKQIASYRKVWRKTKV